MQLRKRLVSFPRSDEYLRKLKDSERRQKKLDGRERESGDGGDPVVEVEEGRSLEGKGAESLQQDRGVGEGRSLEGKGAESLQSLTEDKEVRAVEDGQKVEEKKDSDVGCKEVEQEGGVHVTCVSASGEDVGDSTTSVCVGEPQKDDPLTNYACTGREVHVDSQSDKQVLWNERGPLAAKDSVPIGIGQRSPSGEAKPFGERTGAFTDEGSIRLRSCEKKKVCGCVCMYVCTFVCMYV